jgi:hypothetical protein
MLIEWTEFVDFLRTRVQELARTELDQVRYGSVDLAFLLTVVVAAAILLTLFRLVVRRRSHTRHHSGHLIDHKLQRGPVVRALYHLPKLLLILAVVVLLVAVSDPFLTATEEVRGDVESRVRVDESRGGADSPGQGAILDPGNVP